MTDALEFTPNLRRPKKLHCYLSLICGVLRAHMLTVIGIS